MAGRYDDIPCLISTINRACYRVVLHKDPTWSGRVWRWAPRVLAFFWWENCEKKPVDSGKIHQNPLPVQIPNPFFGSWCFKRSHFYISLHRGSQASLSLWRSVMARSSSIVAPLLVLASVALAVPLAAHLDIARSDEILPPGAPPKWMDSSNTKPGFLWGCSGNSSYLALELFRAQMKWRFW